MSDTIHMLAHASTGSGDSRGNQSGKELSVIQFGNAASSGGWGHVYRFKDEYAEYADKIAEMQIAAVLNGHIGYKQAIRTSALRCMIAHQLGVRYDPGTAKWYDENGDEISSDAMNTLAAGVDPFKMRPWFIENECAMDCSSLVNSVLTIVTGMWYHKAITVDRLSEFYASTQPNRVNTSSKAGAFYPDFCNGTWTPYIYPGTISGTFPCYSVKETKTTVGAIYTTVADEHKNKTLTLIDVEFKLGENNKTVNISRSYYYKNSYYIPDGKGNYIKKKLYRFRIVPCMDHYIADSDGKALLKAVYNEDTGELEGYQRENGTMVHYSYTNCAKWNNDAKVDGNPAQTINCPHGLEGSTPAQVISADTTREHRYVPEDGQTGDVDWDISKEYSVGCVKNASTVIYDYTAGKFEKTTTRALYYHTGYATEADTAGATSSHRIYLYEIGDMKVYYTGTDSQHPAGCVWVRNDSGTPDPTDLVFPMWAMVKCVLVGKQFEYGGTVYTLGTGSTVSVDIVSTGTLYQHWIANVGDVRHDYVRAWDADPQASLADNDEGEEESGKFSSIWYEKVNGVWNQLSAPPFDTGDDSFDDYTETEKPDSVVVKNILPIINYDTNLKRGDILITRGWSEGNTSGGHVAMYV